MIGKPVDRGMWLSIYGSIMTGVLASMSKEPNKHWVAEWSSEMTDVAYQRAIERLGTAAAPPEGGCCRGAAQDG